MFLEILIAACIIAICFGSLALGRFTGARAKRRLAARDSGGVEHMNVLQGALLGLLGLLLGFSFSRTSSSPVLHRVISLAKTLWYVKPAHEHCVASFPVAR
jgi:hypothetical protein